MSAPRQRKFSPVPIPFPPHVDYNKHSVAVPGSERPGQTATFRHGVFPLLTLDTPGVYTNLVDLWDEGLKASKGGPCVGHRPVLSKKPLTFANYHVWQSYPEVDARRRALGSALHTMFQTKELPGGQYDTVGIWSKNCPNWLVVDLALQAYKKVTVALYDTLGADSVEYVINHSALSIVFAAAEHIPFLLTISERLPTLKIVVAIEPMDVDEKRVLTAWGKTKNVKIMDIAEVEEFGRAHLLDVLIPTPDTLASICYTSGTSGVPKGAMLSHGNMVMSVYSFFYGLEDKGDTVMGFLPLAHIFERIMELAAVGVGKRIGYACGDPMRFLEDIQILKPQFVPLVPRVLNRVYQSAMVAGDAPGLKGALFRQAVSTKLQNLHATGSMTHPLWDRVVFKKINNVLGGRLMRIACGSAPFSQNVVEFLKVGLLADLSEGYGMTENAGCCTTSWANDPTSGGTVGGPTAAAEIRLVDVPELGYRVTDKPFPRGELWMRGETCFKGYYKDEAKTKETIDAEGWLHTGDIATMDGAGRFRIIDRVKNIMKLAQGEYVALEHVENVYATCPLVAQLYIHGDPFQSFLVAVLVPDPVQLAALVKRVLKDDVSPEDGAALSRYASDPRIVDAVLTELDKEENVRKLKGFERIKRIHATTDAFTVENSCLTPTLKIRRKETYEKFKPYIDALYALPEPTARL